MNARRTRMVSQCTSIPFFSIAAYLLYINAVVYGAIMAFVAICVFACGVFETDSTDFEEKKDDAEDLDEMFGKWKNGEKI